MKNMNKKSNIKNLELYIKMEKAIIKFGDIEIAPT